MSEDQKNGVDKKQSSCKFYMPTVCPWRRLIDTSKVMTIAVSNHGSAWSAPVYYLFVENRFYFFSNPKAQHIQMAKEGVSAGSIFQDDADMKNLVGIQMSGIILKSPLNAKSILVAKKYCSRFKIIANAMDILGYFVLKFSASLYYFEPDIVYYMDNRDGFGSRKRVKL
ncbi:MAG: hypothetical protein GY710_05800 [Desulfobacteraceae bacterium]|nr:hypothetical protein [Desulfobacteraceae bacterium]